MGGVAVNSSARDRLGRIIRRLRLSAVLFREDANEATRKALTQERAAAVLDGFAVLPEAEAQVKLDAAIAMYPAIAELDPQYETPIPEGKLS